MDVKMKTIINQLNEWGQKGCPTYRTPKGFYFVIELPSYEIYFHSSSDDGSYVSSILVKSTQRRIGKEEIPKKNIELIEFTIEDLTSKKITCKHKNASPTKNGWKCTSCGELVG